MVHISQGERTRPKQALTMPVLDSLVFEMRTFEMETRTSRQYL